ncbi:YaaC family protein [Bacillus benzoevorans]|uniref:YaaC-like Protein n=1 Tax=Bacillus benzoevorans TaxID=1456 RepID=A0A7X0HWC9_9BACI|nr:YaaC family protein [Bacillus benzoevorans]MBB6447961.1 hypothetical protein [Bacillus benzoevorans]
MIHSYKNFQSFSHFFSASDTQSYLQNGYKKLGIENAEQKGYENSYPFIYYLEHAKIYYEQSMQSPLLIKPILLFYGFVHLIKACILTTNPNYPENTTVLSHGVSTRKRKKQQYEFFDDEVKYQKNGLFPYMLERMFNIKHMEGDKITMREMLQQIPELAPMFTMLEKQNTFMKIPLHQSSFAFPIKVIDHFHMTENRFVEYIQNKSSGTLSFQKKEHNLLLFDCHNSHSHLLPFKYHLEDQDFYFSLLKRDLLNFPELLVHYLLLYNLSMIARYETEWWSELLKTMPNRDYPFIVSFLDVTSEKGPFLAYQYLTTRDI